MDVKFLIENNYEDIIKGLNLEMVKAESMPNSSGRLYELDCILCDLTLLRGNFYDFSQETLILNDNLETLTTLTNLVISSLVMKRTEFYTEKNIKRIQSNKKFYFSGAEGVQLIIDINEIDEEIDTINSVIRFYREVLLCPEYVSRKKFVKRIVSLYPNSEHNSNPEYLGELVEKKLNSLFGIDGVSYYSLIVKDDIGLAEIFKDVFEKFKDEGGEIPF